MAEPNRYRYRSMATVYLTVDDLDLLAAALTASDLPLTPGFYSLATMLAEARAELDRRG